MRPKLQADVIYIQAADGVYLRKNKGSLKLKGKSAYRLLESLVPYLTGHYSLEEITQGLDSERKAMVTRLIETLLTNQFAKDAEQDQPHQLSEQELATYASEITFIDSFQTSAASRFENFRKKQLLIIGSGLSLTCLVQAALHCGIKQVNVMMTPECEAISVPYPDTLNLFTKNDPQQTVHLLSLPSYEDESDILQAIQGYDVVLHISDRPMLARARLLNKVCFEQKKTLIQAILVEDQAWIGPLVGLKNDACWECAWRRLQSHRVNNTEQLQQYAFGDKAAVPVSRFHVVSTAMLVANRLLFELFKYLTQAGPVTLDGNMVEIDLTTLVARPHAFLPYPHCQTCQHPVAPDRDEFLAEIHRKQQREPMDLANFSKDAVRCIDNELGLVEMIGEDDFVQAPLAISQVTLPAPMLQEQSGHAVKITCAGMDLHSARMQAIQRACENYAVHLFDDRRLLSEEFAQQYASITIPAEQFLENRINSLAKKRWSWGVDLHTQLAHLVPASLVFAPAEEETVSIPGVASGQSWDEALCVALFQWGTFLTIAKLKDGHHPYAQVAIDTTPMTPTGLYLYDVLRTVGEQVTIYDVTGMLQIPTFAICLGRTVVAYSTHCDSALALELALEQAVQHYQSLHSQQPAYALPPVPDLPISWRGDALAISHEVVGESWSRRLHWLVKRFQANGLRVIAIPLDHDHACNEVLPSLVRVLIARVAG